MTDKEKKSKIADILMDFQEEYSNEVINRPMLASLYAGNILSFIDSLQEEPALTGEEQTEIDFEQELYKAFGQVKDFTLGMRIAKWFYDMGKNSQEPVSEDLGKVADQYSQGIESDYTNDMFDRGDIYEAVIYGAQWQKQQTITKACDWLKRNADSYTWYNEFEGESGMTEDFIDELKKAIQ